MAIAIDTVLVRRLIAAQYPRWANLPVLPVAHGGWDNRTFHLGREMIVRLPSAARYAAQVEKEQQWLPRLAPHLPLPIPVPLAMGRPGEGFPWPWSVYRWIEGETADKAEIVDLDAFARALAGFLKALYAVDPADGPPPGQHNFFRGGPLDVYDDEVRRALAVLKDDIDLSAAEETWEAALAAKPQRPPVWFHGDVAAGNLLVDRGRLGAVIDFGTCGIGDPSCDLTIAWTMFENDSRQAFHDALPLDAGTWSRGRGWALWKALIVCAGLAGTDTREVGKSRRVIDAVLADHHARRR